MLFLICGKINLYEPWRSEWFIQSCSEVGLQNVYRIIQIICNILQILNLRGSVPKYWPLRSHRSPLQLNTFSTVEDVAGMKETFPAEEKSYGWQILDLFCQSNWGINVTAQKQGGCIVHILDVLILTLLALHKLLSLKLCHLCSLLPLPSTVESAIHLS